MTNSEKAQLSSNEDYTLANVERLLIVAVDGFDDFEDPTDDEPSKPFAALEDALGIVKELLARQANSHETRAGELMIARNCLSNLFCAVQRFAPINDDISFAMREAAQYLGPPHAQKALAGNGPKCECGHWDTAHHIGSTTAKGPCGLCPCMQWREKNAQQPGINRD